MLKYIGTGKVPFGHEKICNRVSMVAYAFTLDLQQFFALVLYFITVFSKHQLRRSVITVYGGLVVEARLRIRTPTACANQQEKQIKYPYGQRAGPKWPNPPKYKYYDTSRGAISSMSINICGRSRATGGTMAPLLQVV
jgi:hypothetical protein